MFGESAGCQRLHLLTYNIS